MKKYLKYIVIAAALIIFLIPASANEHYTIEYDFGAANIRSEYIENNNPTEFISGQEIKLNPPSCPGFEFKGWFIDDSHTQEIKTIDADSASDITLYAKWYESSFSINYVLTTPGISVAENEITNQNPTSRMASESTHISAPMCSTDNYTFDGWFLDADYTQKTEFIDSYTCEDVTLYAHWINSSFPIHYDLGAAEHSVYKTENPNPDFYKYNTELALQDAHTEDPSFTFDGWYSDSDFTEKITSIPSGTSGNTVIYAKWIVKSYKINYVLTDNSGIDGSKISNYNPTDRESVTDLILSDPVSEDKSFEFAGWYTSETLDDNTEISVIKANYYDDITLYAKWIPAVYSISYNYGQINQSYLKIENPNPIEYRFADNTKLEPIEADGFIFNGWCTDKELKNKVSALPTEIYGDITLYADFTEKTYSIEYVLSGNGVEGAQVVNNNPTIRTTTEQTSLNDAETFNLEYEFDGWYLDAEYTQAIEYIRAYTTGNITLYAKWIKNVTYQPVWGDATLSDQLSAADARLILRYSAGLETAFTDLQIKLSDVNNDSKVNAADARIVVRLSANIENEEKIIETYSLPEIAIEDGEIVFREKNEN